MISANLGLNDYLSVAIPNMLQETRSNLVEVKRNKTMQWLDVLPKEKQDKVLEMAVENRRKVSKQRKEQNEKRSEQRRDHILREHTRRQALQQKAQKMKDKLSQLHLITSSDELYCAIHEIDEENISNSKKKTKKLALLRTQVNIRKKVLEQDICIIFTRSRKQRPLDEIIKDLSDFISTHSSSNLDIIHNPASLIGKSISHKFEIEESHDEQWYDGVIIDYNDETKLFEIVYEGKMIIVILI